MKKLAALLLCCLMLTACASTADPTIPGTTGTPVQPTAAPTEGTQPPTDAPTEAPTEAPAEAPTEPVKITFTVYSGNDNADGFVATEVEVEELSDTVVIQKLIDAGVLAADAALNSFDAAEGTLYLDFNTAFADQLMSQGSAGEKMLMGGVVNTFLSAYDAQYVVITVEGAAPESGHVVYDFPLEFYN